MGGTVRAVIAVDILACWRMWSAFEDRIRTVLEWSDTDP